MSVGPIRKQRRHRFDDFGRIEQSGFDRADRETAEQELDLFPHIRSIDGIDSRHLSRHFRDHTGHGGDAENAQSAEGFQVGLQPGASA